MAKKETGKKHFESKFDAKLLRQMIQDGKNADEIQEALCVVSKQSLRQHVLKLINEDRQFYEVPGLYVRNLKRPQVNFKGEIRLTKKMLEFRDSTYAHGDQFEMDISNERIVLTRVTNLPESDPENTAEIPNKSLDALDEQSEA
ncbi:MAG: hypothetical protein AB7D07_11610 [Desulfovibrionaceae bacterium]|jgi:hypothetical protein